MLGLITIKDLTEKAQELESGFKALYEKTVVHTNSTVSAVKEELTTLVEDRLQPVETKLNEAYQALEGKIGNLTTRVDKVEQQQAEVDTFAKKRVEEYLGTLGFKVKDEGDDERSLQELVNSVNEQLNEKTYQGILRGFRNIGKNPDKLTWKKGRRTTIKKWLEEFDSLAIELSIEGDYSSFPRGFRDELIAVFGHYDTLQIDYQELCRTYLRNVDRGLRLELEILDNRDMPDAFREKLKTNKEEVLKESLKYLLMGAIEGQIEEYDHPIHRNVGKALHKATQVYFPGDQEIEQFAKQIVQQHPQVAGYMHG